MVNTFNNCPPRNFDLSLSNELADLTDGAQAMAALIDKTDILLKLQKLNTIGYHDALLVKGHALRYQVRFIKDLGGKVRQLKEIEKMIEPYYMSPKGVYLYLQTLRQLRMCYQMGSMESQNQGLKVLQKAEKVYHDYVKANGGNQCWDCEHLLGISKVSDSKVESMLVYMWYQIASDLWEDYRRRGDLENANRYSMDTVRCVEYTMTERARLFTNFQILCFVIEVTLRTRRLKQLDHLLAGTMHHVVKYRRSLPESERHKVDFIQGRLSSAYAQWGLLVLGYSIEQWQQQWDFTAKFDNDSYETIKMFTEAGVETYAGQFPTELYENRVDLKIGHKRALSWGNRALKLISSSTEGAPFLATIQKSLACLKSMEGWI